MCICTDLDPGVAAQGLGEEESHGYGGGGGGAHLYNCCFVNQSIDNN